MMTLDFKNSLINNRFTYNNDYIYSDLDGLNIYYKESEEEIPFIMTAKNDVRGSNPVLFHNGEMQHSTYSRQLGGRTLTTNRIKEILDGSKIPLLFKIGNHRYLIGKGFLAWYQPDGTHEVLFIAVSKRDVSYMGDVKFYVSRTIYNIRHKKLHPVIKDFMTIHTGDTILTNNIKKYIGSKIEMPTFKTVGSRLKYQKSLIQFCTREYAKQVPKLEVKMVAEDPKKVKKAKEAEIMEALRSAAPFPTEVGNMIVDYVGSDSPEGDYSLPY